VVFGLEIVGRSVFWDVFLALVSGFRVLVLSFLQLVKCLYFTIENWKSKG